MVERGSCLNFKWCGSAGGFVSFYARNNLVRVWIHWWHLVWRLLSSVLIFWFLIIYLFAIIVWLVFFPIIHLICLIKFDWMRRLFFKIVFIFWVNFSQIYYNYVTIIDFVSYCIIGLFFRFNEIDFQNWLFIVFITIIYNAFFFIRNVDWISLLVAQSVSVEILNIFKLKVFFLRYNKRLFLQVVQFIVHFSLLGLCKPKLGIILVYLLIFINIWRLIISKIFVIFFVFIILTSLLNDLVEFKFVVDLWIPSYEIWFLLFLCPLDRAVG